MESVKNTQEIHKNMKALIREMGPRRVNGEFHTSLFQRVGQRLQARADTGAGEQPWLEAQESRQEK